MRIFNGGVMNANRKLANKLFAAALRDGLSAAFGRLPSAAKFADAFNLRAHGTSTITRETARKWLRGDALPEIGKLRVLISWLHLDPTTFLQPLDHEADPRLHGKASLARDEKPSVTGTLVDLLRHLDDESIETLYLTAMAMKEMKKMKTEAGFTDPTRLRIVLN